MHSQPFHPPEAYAKGDLSSLLVKVGAVHRLTRVRRVESNRVAVDRVKRALAVVHQHQVIRERHAAAQDKTQSGLRCAAVDAIQLTGHVRVIHDNTPRSRRFRLAIAEANLFIL